MPASVSVGQLLNSAQDSNAASERCASSLWKLAIADPDGTYEELRRCVDYLVTVSQKSLYVERCVRFFGVFAAKAPVDSEASAAIIEELLQHLTEHLSALDKTVRYRSAQLLQQILSSIPDSLLLEDSIIGELCTGLNARLKDKQPAVRAEACKAISHLALSDEDRRAVVADMQTLLDTDKSKDVRIAVVRSLPLDNETLPTLLERARDINLLVRKAVVARLKGLSITFLSIKQRAELVQQLLQDRDAAVAEAAANLLSHWLDQDCGSDPLQLLQLLDVETHTDAAVLAVDSLISSGSIYSNTADSHSSSGVIAYVEAAITCRNRSGHNDGSLVGLRHLANQRQDEQLLLEAHEALLWRCLCEWLRRDAVSKGLAAAATGGARAQMQAAVATERHEVLERALPESAGQLMDLVMRHAVAGPAARFATTQLMMIASACVEWTDAASRSMALPYLQQLIDLDPLAEAEQDVDDEAVAGMQLAGNGGDGMFETAVVQLVLAVQGPGTAFTVAMLDGIAPLAAAAGLIPKPGSEASAAVTEAGQMLQCLAYIKLLLQKLPLARPVEDEGAGLSFNSLWNLLLLLALKQDDAAVRSAAVECIGLYAMACANNSSIVTSAVHVLGPLLAADSCCATKQAAVKALADLALLLGPAAVDHILSSSSTTAVPGPDVEASDDAEGGQSGTDAHSLSVQLAKGLLALLIEQAEVLLAEVAVPAAKPKRSGREVSASKAEPSLLSATQADLLSAIAEALCKLLLHQRSWLKRYPPSTTTAADVAGCDVTAVNSSSSSFPLSPDSQQQQKALLAQALSLLLQLQFHPATEEALALRQCLSVFFDVFTAAAEDFRLQLVNTSILAARKAATIVSKKNPAALLTKYVLQLLQATQTDQQEQALAGKLAASQLEDGYMVAAACLLTEVLNVANASVNIGFQPAKYKPYLSAVLKMLCELPLSPRHCNFAAVQLMALQLSNRISDATLSKDIASLQQLLSRLAQEAGIEQQQLAQEAVDELLEKVKAMSLQLLPMPGAAAAGVPPTPATIQRATRKASSKTSAPASKATGVTAGRTRRTAAKKAKDSSSEDETESTESSSSEDDSDSDSSAESEYAQDSEEQRSAGVTLAAACVKALPASSRSAPRRSSAGRQPLAPTTVDNSM